jgi:hypothetical protein
VAALGLAALIAGTSAVLACGAPAMATAGNAPGNTLASVIPSTAVRGSPVTFSVYCASAGATSATLFGRPLGLTSQIKMRANPAGGDFTVSVLLPDGIRPGTYHPSIGCSDGTATTARLLVPAFTYQSGNGTTSASIWLAAGGLVLMGAGAVTGVVALRRRNRGRSGRPDLTAVPDSSSDSDHSDRLNQFRQSDQSNVRF